MATITWDYEPSPGDVANWTSLKADIDDIVGEINGSLDADNLAANAVESAKIAANAVTSAKIAAANILEAAINWTSAGSGVEAWRTGPNYVGANGGRIARVQKSITTAAATEESFTVTFASDCVDGDPAFSAAPTLLGAPSFRKDTDDETLVPDQVWIKTISSTTCVFRILRADATAQTLVVEFGLAGPA
jgi:hypothetical protein